MQQLAPSSVSCAKIELSADFMLPVVSIVRQKRDAPWVSILNQEQAGLHLRLGWGNLRMHSAGFVQRAAIARLSAYVFAPGEWLLSQFSRLDKTQWPILWVIGLFIIQAVPATIVRASNLEEGRIIAIARGAIEDGHWLTPFLYGDRFAERPVLLSWISALFGELTGGVTLWSLRIPHLGIFLAGALLIYGLIRSNAGKSAAIFGALCWLSMPMVAPKFINAEPDIVMSTLLFGAFYTWWWERSAGA